MKIMKSGIEMTPQQLEEMKGSVCACGCGIGFSGEQLNTNSGSGKGCYCGCARTLPGDPTINNIYESNSSAAYVFMVPNM